MYARCVKSLLLALAIAALSPLANAQVTMRIPSHQPWTDTGIAVAVGESVAIGASGVIQVGPLSNPSWDQETPNGQPWPGCATGLTGFVAPGLPCWSLIGKISRSGKPFEIGAFAGFTAKAGGELYLGVNANAFADNSGAWTAVAGVYTYTTINVPGAVGTSVQGINELCGKSWEITRSPGALRTLSC